MIRPDYLIGTKNEVFGPGGIQNAVVETLVRTEGPIDAKLVDKSISDNGTYSASAEGADGFKKVTVDVPNTYLLSDEGKVVSGGSLVTQTSSTVTENGVVDTTLIDSVTVSVSGSGGPVYEKDVNFYDYEGTLVASYTTEEFLNLSQMPQNPTHEYLISRGWNWSLVDAKDYVNKYKQLNIGQMYNTIDGKTRFFVDILEGKLDFSFYFGQEGTIKIDWGDNTELEIIDTNIGYATHTYVDSGKYVITIEGHFSYEGEGTSWIDEEIETSPSVYGIMFGNTDRFNQFLHLDTDQDINLEFVVIPYGKEHVDMQFNNPQSLKILIIPDGLTNLSDLRFDGANSLITICFPSEISSEGVYMFFGINTKSLTFPESGPLIPFYPGSYYDLDTILNYNLKSITIPDGVTTVGGFGNCAGLRKIILSNTLEGIGSDAFSNCYSLTSITIPETVTYLGNSCFDWCHSLQFIKFLSMTPPSCAGDTSPIGNIPEKCVIYVPQGSLQDYLDNIGIWMDPEVNHFIEY